MQLTPEQVQLLSNFQALMGAGGVGQKNNPSQTTGSFGPYAQGNTGLWNLPGSRNPVFSAIIKPLPGLAGSIPLRPAGTGLRDLQDFGGEEAPFFQTITGITKGDGEALANQKVNKCDPAPRMGIMKAHAMTAPYGRFSAQLGLDIRDVGRLFNRGSSTNLVLANAPGPSAGNNFMPMALQGQSNPFNNELDKKMTETLMGFFRYFFSRFYVADPTNNTAGDGYKEFIGWDLQVNTAKVDYLGNVTPRMDSIVWDYNYGNASAATSRIMEWMESMVRHIMHRATRMWGSVTSIDLSVAMRGDLYEEIIRIIPVQKYWESLAQMASFPGGQVFVDARNALDERDAMRRNRVIPLYGQLVRVIIDDTITEDDSTGGNVGAGFFESDVYFTTHSINGIEAVWWEAFNQDNLQAQAMERMINGGTQGGPTFTSDGGLYRWFSSFLRGCWELDFELEPRVVNVTPYLCGRIQNVAYAPFMHTDDWDPDGDYFYNGGRTVTPEETAYTDWSKTTPVSIGGR